MLGVNKSPGGTRTFRSLKSIDHD